MLLLFVLGVPSFTVMLLTVARRKVLSGSASFRRKCVLAHTLASCCVPPPCFGASLSPQPQPCVTPTPLVRRRYGFLFDGYDAERGWAWWEAVVMLRKVLVTAIAVFLDDSFMQVYAATILLTVALVAQAYVSPFTSDLHNNLELLSLVASQVTQVRCGMRRSEVPGALLAPSQQGHLCGGVMWERLLRWDRSCTGASRNGAP